VLGSREHGGGRCRLDDPPRVHHGDLIRHLGHHAEIVRDDHDRHPQLALMERLHGHIQRGRRLVGDQQLGLVRERHRDHHALAHPPGELVRKLIDAPRGIGNPHEPQQLDGALARLALGHRAMRAHRLGQLATDFVKRMQRRERVLEDHRDVVAANRAQLVFGQRDQIFAFELDLPRDASALTTREPERRQRGHRLARSRLADDPERASFVHLVADPVDGVHHPVLGRKLHAQVLHAQQRPGDAHQKRTRGSRYA
jgi:hypothetical protein